ncbi:MAG: TonB-dependent receptor [Cyclobacteriaceae bacterium]
MKNSRLFICVLLLCLKTISYAQTSLPETVITIREKEKTVEELLQIIESKSGISFAYSSNNLPKDLKISIDAEQKSISEILDEVLLGLDLKYQWIEQKVVLTKSGKEKNVSKYTISGYVRDRVNGENLIGATVQIKNSYDGNITNAYGFYSITLPAGRYQLMFSYVGYENQEIPVVLNKNVSIEIPLTPTYSFLEAVVVAPSDSIREIEHATSNAFEIDPNRVVTKPTALGEADLIKSLDVIPGVQLFRDGSTFFNVRGGDRDQNQMLVDEAPIYNPAHFLGLFSVFVPEAIKDVKLYKGNAPAEYGGRVSSVMDIHTKDGNKKEFGLNGSVGFVSTRLSVEGPIKKDKSSFFLSGRRSHVGSIVRGLGADFDQLYFSDFTGKVNLRLNQKNRLFVSTFLSKDEFLADGGLRWENKAGTIRWNHLFGSRLFLNTTFYTSKYEYNLITGQNIIWKNNINNASLKTDFIFYKHPKSTMKFGLRISGHHFNPGNIEDFAGNQYDFVPKRNASESSLYFSHDKQLGNKWLLNYGFRLSSWTNFGRTIEYEFNEDYQVIDSTIYNTRASYNEYTNLEPRLNLSWHFHQDHFLKFNYSRTAQYINLISNSISPFNNLEVWLPASVNIKPQLGNQISFGWIYNKPKWKLEVDAYGKILNNQLDYVDQAQLLLNPHLEGELRAGRSRVYGFEGSLTKNTGKLTGWLSYIYSRSFRNIPGINNGRTYPTLWDRPHQFLMSINYSHSKRTTFSGTFLLSSGAPNSRPTSYYQYAGRTVPVYSSRNNSRLPVYHRFDAGMNHRLNKRDQRFNHFLSIAVFNFYAQKNTILESFNKIQETNGTYIVPVSNNEGTIAPTYRFLYSLVPSLTYSFKL